MTPQIIHYKLSHAVTEYDRKQAARPSHNPYALPQYLAAAERVVARIERGEQPGDALGAELNDRLLTVCRKALGIR